jgi:uncharacterized protein YbjT (DUF2867 family)
MGSSSSKPSSKTIIVGASGCVGKATLEALSTRHYGADEPYAGVRDVAGFEKHALKIPTIRTDLADKPAITRALQGFENVFLVVPCTTDRTALAINGLEAAKEAGAGFILVLSITLAGTDTIFGRQFTPIEDRAKVLGIPYTIIRLPLFMDNNFAHIASIAKQNNFCDPRNPGNRFASVAVDDVGKCAADILASPKKHHYKTYKLIGQSHSVEDSRAALSKFLHRPIKIKTVTYHSFKMLNMDNGIPEWQIDGLIEWLKHEDAAKLSRKDAEAIETITGERPMSIQDFIAVNATAFGWKL